MKWSKRPDGYYVAWIEGVLWYRHRWVWTQANGPIPAGHTIDHKDGIAGHDDIDNLQCISNMENNRLGTLGLKSTNTSGFNCVQRNRIGKWVGSFRHLGARVHCGSHSTPEQANAAVLAKREELNAPTRRMAIAGEEAGCGYDHAGIPREGTPT